MKVVSLSTENKFIIGGINMLFGQKLKQLRLNAGLTQANLASELGVTKRTLINYEKGKCYPKKTDIYARISSLFGVTTDYLLSDEDNFIIDAGDHGGSYAMNQARTLVSEVSGLFAGGTLDEEDKDAVMQAIMDAYWDAKKTNQKYAKAGQKEDV